MTPLIRCENSGFRTGGTWLLRGVGAAFSAGEFHGILGPNGAGKSTFLKLLCGEHALSEGNVEFDGAALAAWKPRWLAMRRAVLPQVSSIPFAFTALEVVLLGRTPHGDGGRMTQRALELMESTDCRHLADRTVNTLSGGELQRVNLARVLLQIDGQDLEGTALLLDEPISNLDPLHQHLVLQLANAAAERGVCVIAVLHDLNLAAQYCRQILMFRQGQLCHQGAPGEVLQPGILREVFSVDAVVTLNPLCPAPAIFVSVPRSRETHTDTRRSEPKTPSKND